MSPYCFSCSFFWHRVTCFSNLTCFVSRYSIDYRYFIASPLLHLCFVTRELDV
jgi:hypothetical protein